MNSNKYLDGNPRSNLYVFPFRHHQDFVSVQLIKGRFDFRPAAPVATNLIGYILLLTNKLVLVSSDVQKQFDLR